MSRYDELQPVAVAALHDATEAISRRETPSKRRVVVARLVTSALVALVVLSGAVMVGRALSNEPEAAPLSDLPYAFTDTPPTGMQLVSVSNTAFDLEGLDETVYLGFERPDDEVPLAERAFVLAAGANLGPSGDADAVATPAGLVYVRDEESGDGFRSAAFEQRDGQWVAALSAALTDDELVQLVSTSELRDGELDLGELPDGYVEVGELDLLALNGGPMAVYARVGSSVSEVNVDRSSVRISSTSAGRATTFFLELIGGGGGEVIVDGEAIAVTRQEFDFGDVALSVGVPVGDDTLVIVAGSGITLAELQEAVDGVRIPDVDEVAGALLEVGSGFGTFGNPSFETDWSATVLDSDATYSTADRSTARAMVWLDDCEDCMVLLETLARAAQSVPEVEVVGVVSDEVEVGPEPIGATVVVADAQLERSIRSVTFRAPSTLLTAEDGALVQTIVGPLSQELAEGVLRAFVAGLESS